MLDSSKDQDIVRKLIPYPEETWNNYVENLKLEARKRGTLARFLMMKMPPTIDELPTHFVLSEGKRRRTSPIEWPKAACDLEAVCTGENECFYFLNRGYLCKRHSPSVDN